MTDVPRDSEMGDEPVPDRPLSRLERGPIVLPRRAPDFNDLEDEMMERYLEALLYMKRLFDCHTGLDELWLFLNPLGIVVSSKATAEFFRRIREIQGRWGLQSSTVFPPSYRRSIRDFFSPSFRYSDDRKLRRTEHFELQGLCAAGLMIRNGVPLAPHDWRRVEKRVYRPKRRRKKRRSRPKASAYLPEATVPVMPSRIPVPLDQIPVPEL